MNSKPTKWKTIAAKLLTNPSTYNFFEQTHFVSQKTKHGRKMEWVIGIVNALTLMETKNYM